MASNPKTFYTPEEYLAFERSVPNKHEYFGGEISAIGRVSADHVLVVTNLVGELVAQVKGESCRVYSAALRVRVGPTGFYTYPDVIVLCDEPRFSDDHEDTLLNPALIIEVLSESTKDYDRGGKFEKYRTIDSFVEYLVIAEDRPHVEHWVRQPDKVWVLHETNSLEDTIHLKSVPCSLPLSEIYDKIDFPST